MPLLVSCCVTLIVAVTPVSAIIVNDNEFESDYPTWHSLMNIPAMDIMLRVFHFMIIAVFLDGKDSSSQL